MSGDFMATDRVLVWSTEGKGYLYKLPAKYVLCWGFCRDSYDKGKGFVAIVMIRERDRYIAIVMIWARHIYTYKLPVRFIQAVL